MTSRFLLCTTSLFMGISKLKKSSLLSIVLIYLKLKMILYILIFSVFINQ
jgi:hypothetical protein